MREPRPIALVNVELDRFPIKRVIELVDHMRAGGAIPPIHVQPNGMGQYKVLDGRHRTLVAKLLGHTHIMARFSEQVRSIT